MKNNMMDFIQVFATYSDIFRMPKFDKTKLTQIIRELPLGGLLGILSGLSHQPIDNNELKKGFIRYIKDISGEEILNHEVFDACLLLNPQGLSLLWKWLLIYGDSERLCDSIDYNRGVLTIVYLCMIVSDYLYEKIPTKDDIIFEMIRNAGFNSNEDLGTSIVRAKLIFVDIVEDKTKFYDKEYIDFVTDFTSIYGYSIGEYISVLFGLFAYHVTTNNQYIGVSTDLFSATSLNDKAKKIIESLTVDFSKAKEWATKTLDRAWDYSLFQEFPYISLNPSFNNSLLISPKFINEKVFQRVYNKIRRCYPQEDKKILGFIGRPFEYYIAKLALEAGDSSRLPYNVITDFAYGKDSKRSPI